MALQVLKSWKIAFFFFICISSSLIAMAGCARYDLFIPAYQDFTKPPDETTIEQLVYDYTADEVTADAKYKGKGLLLNEVEVDNLDGYWVYIGLGEWVFEKTFFYSGTVKFELRGDDYAILQNIEEGYVLTIVGECQGLVSGVYNKEPYIFINDCWVNNISGDLRNSTWEAPMY